LRSCWPRVAVAANAAHPWTGRTFGRPDSRSLRTRRRFNSVPQLAATVSAHRAHRREQAMNNRLIVGAAIGDCVHVAGVVNFLNLAEELGYETICLGPAISVDALLEKVAAHDPGVVAVGYRLTPENCRNLLGELTAKAATTAGGRSWLFGGTEPCVAIAHETGLFQMAFASGASKQAVV